jgi:type IV pilus assembly protein PilM
MHIKSIRLPKMPIDEMREAVAFEAKDRLPTRDPLTIQFLQAGEVRQGDDIREEVILLAISTPLVEQHVNCLLEAGLKPTAVDATPCAIARLHTSEQAEPIESTHDDGITVPPARMVVDIGYDASKVLIVRGGQIMFYKLVQIGGQQFDQEISQHLHIERTEANDLRTRMDRPDEAPTGTHVQRAIHEALRTPMHELAHEIGLCLRYFGVTFRGERPQTLELTGGESACEMLRNLLAEQLGMPITPLVNIDSEIDWPDRVERFALATGLAMRIEAGWGERRKFRRAAA